MAGTDTTLFPRFSTERILTALKDTPVVMINGPRQCGKTTLVRQLASTDPIYITLDDDTALAAARNDPTGFIRQLDYAIIDEVQRAPELLRAIKKAVDDDRRPGRFLLTGSTHVLTMPTVSESLAGRIEIVHLLPLSLAEIRNKKPAFLEHAFAGALVKPAEVMIDHALVQTALTGGYPEMFVRQNPKRRHAWRRDYLHSLLQRDVRDIASIEKLDHLPRLLQILAHHSGQLINFTQIAGQLGLDGKTASKYLAVFEQLFLVYRLKPWFRNQIKRMIKTPKLHFFDAGLLASLLSLTTERIAENRTLFGPILETFVVSEVMKQITWSDEAYTLHHYRDKEQSEVDLVVENEIGAVLGIEIKASASIHADDFKGLRKLAQICQDEFKLGIVFYNGENIIPFGDRLFAAPISCLWGSA
ncbi:MAG: hypothetical protein ON057_001119 [Glomeribacter sp. 1016415]|nr:hypothetical protein [Glomeribacter sp. 1016415]